MLSQADIDAIFLENHELWVEVALLLVEFFLYYDQEDGNER